MPGVSTIPEHQVSSETSSIKENKLFEKQTIPKTTESCSTTEARQPQISVSSQAFNMFLIKSIEKIANERETRKSQNAFIRKACEEALIVLKNQPLVENNESNQISDSGSHLPPLRSDGILLTDEKLLRPFQLACTMKSAKIVSTAIDSLQKLIAYGHISNTAVCSSGKVRIIEQVVTTICSCFQGTNTDDAIQLQIIKALLTVVTSSVVEVHEADVLLIVRICYNIYMATKNSINQATARATLTQIISVIFQRMEQSALEAVVVMNSSNDESKGDEGETNLNSSTMNNCKLSADMEKEQNVPNELNGYSDNLQHSTDSLSLRNSPTDDDQSSKCVPIDNDDPHVVIRAMMDQLVDKVVNSVEGDSHKAPLEIEPNHSPLNQTQSAHSICSPNESLSSFQSSRTSDWSTTDDVAKSSSTDPTGFDSKELHAVDDDDDLTSNTNVMSAANGASADVVTSAHITQKDAFLVFRSLCRLAIKDCVGPNSLDPKSHSVRSKTLSLQLLLSLLQQPGPLFCSSEIFIAAIKQYLCVALFKNGTTPVVVEVFDLTVAIFLALMTHFKPYLKRQMEIFFKDVLFAVLDSNKSSYEHKIIVIDALRCVCADAQCVVDIYLNYDCDMNMTNIFERLTTTLSKIAQGPNQLDCASSSASVLQQQHHQVLRSHGLECLVFILKCMTDWSNELYSSPESQSFLGAEPNLHGAINGSSGLMATLESADVANKTLDDPEDFESRKAQKEIYETGIGYFNNGKATRGLHLLQQNHLVGESAEAVAQFLFTEDRLTKSSIGEFLGDNDPNHLRVMYAFVDQFDFTDKEFLDSIREFLTSFRLPGEAQKIDRIMEKFAARYCTCNPGNGLFVSADTAYVLAFSIIMLTTDLHSGQIKAHNRMTKADYIRMNRGINESQDLPEEYLAQIYDAIAMSGLKLREDDDHAVKMTLAVSSINNASSAAGSKKDAGLNEHDYKASNLLDFTCATHCEHIRPMFKLAWTSFLAAFSVGLQDSDASNVAYLCLEGIRNAIRIACIFRMELERDAYVQALSRFTLLLTSGNLANPNAAQSIAAQSGLATSNHQMAASRRLRTDKSQGASHHPTVNSVVSAIASSTTQPELMKQKNIDSIRTLITVAQTDGNYLGHTAWLEILRCVSQLESTQLVGGQTNANAASNSHGLIYSIGTSSLISRSYAGTYSNSPTVTSMNSNVKRQSATLQQVSSNSTSHSSNSQQSQLTSPTTADLLTAGTLAAATVDSRKTAGLHDVMGVTGSQSVLVAVDKIFTGSIRLDGNAIVEFAKALAQVSHEELNLPQPRTFSLQKVVEISYYNMGRIRLQWSRIWEHIGNHFITAGRSKDEDVAEFVIDSLRQLSVKLIEKGELPNFNFQKEFLRPFVNILEDESNVSRKVQDMIVRCVYQLVHSQYPNIRSGWTNIFAVFHTVASSTDEVIVHMAFEACHFTVKDVFPNYLHVAVEAFQPLVKALAEFACNPHFPDMAMESIRLIRICAQTVADQGCKFLSVQSVDSQQLSQTTPGNDPWPAEDQIWLKGWMPVLCELLRIINSCKLDVRTRGLTVFFDVLKSYGNCFKPLWWRETFSVIFRVFHHFRNSVHQSHSEQVNEEGGRASSEDISSQANGLAEHSSLMTRSHLNATTWTNLERTEWMNTTCNHTLFSIVDIFTQFYDVLHDILLDDIYHQLRWCCMQEHEQLARSGTSCLETLVLSNGNRFNSTIWDCTIDLLVNLFKDTVPSQLLTWRPEQTSSEDAFGSDGSGTDHAVHLARAHLFADLLNKCVVQYELIQTVDHILFYSAHSRNEDVHYLNKARDLAVQSYPAYAAAFKAANVGTKTFNGPSPSPTTSTGTSRYSFQIANKMDRDPIDADVMVNVEEFNGEASVKNFLPTQQDDFGDANSTDDACRKSELTAAKPLPINERGMYAYMSPKQRLILVKCLLESHVFAKTFNSHDEQRNILFQAGFKVKAKPNLLKQETHSLLCALRILFRLADEPSELSDEADELLRQVIEEALSYYHGLIIDGHKHAWDPCLILILTQLYHIQPSERFHKHAIHLYPSFCDLVSMAGGISPQVAALIRLFLLRCLTYFMPLSRSANAC